MAREVGNLYPTTLTFPINFKPIGLNYKLTLDAFDSLDSNLGDLKRECQPAVVDTIQSQIVDPIKDKSELIKGGELHFKDRSLRPSREHIRYRVERALGSGSFGLTAIVRDIDTGELFCLKRQLVYNDTKSELDAFKEAMMHHILDVDTRPDGFVRSQSNLIPRLYHVVRSAREEIYIYFIMDLMTDALHEHLFNIPTYHGRLIEFTRCLFEIIPTLELLYKKGSYTHGDLHMGNVMYDARSQTYKIIDYGFSRIVIGSGKELRIFQLNEANDRNDPSRDLTQLITAFELSHKIDKVQFTDGSFEHGVQQLIRSVAYESRCSGSGPAHPAHTHDMVGAGWGASYRYLNKHTNVNGTYTSVQQMINQLPRWNAEPSAVSHKPVSAFSAARAAVTASIRQINQQNQGVILLYFLISAIAFIVGSKIYYGQGGRDPIMNSLELYHLSKPVIPSKHITYESMSFQPTKSIQMKFSNNSKTRSNNSKTRTNRSVKNNTRRRSHKIPYAKIEDFDKLSLVSFYHFLRFEAFSGISQKEKKEMFKIAAMVPLQRPDVFEQIVEAVKENDFYNMMAILKENQLDLSKLSKLGMEIEPYQELWNSIIDAYFKEKDSSFELLQTLLHVGGNVEDFLKRYHSADKETKKMMVMQTCITASDFPELMLE